MSSSLPGLIQWNSNYALHIPSIDEQHQLLVSIIRHLQEAMLEMRTSEVVLPLFQAMRRYTDFHFSYEEQLLRQHQYPYLDGHEVLHAALLQQLEQLEVKYAERRLTMGAPVMQFLQTWLLDHIAVHDRKYAAFLHEKGVIDDQS